MASRFENPQKVTDRCQFVGCNLKISIKYGHEFCAPHASCCNAGYFDPSKCASCNKVIMQLQSCDNFDIKYQVARPLM